MRTRTFTLLLLALAAPAWGQPVPTVANAEMHGPLNLSLPREVTRSTFSSSGEAATSDHVEGNVRSTQADRRRDTQGLPFGSGYEARQRSAAANGSSSGGGRGSGAGRGGMGRGR